MTAYDWFKKHADDIEKEISEWPESLKGNDSSITQRGTARNATAKQAKKNAKKTQ